MKSLLVFALLGFVLSTSFAFPSVQVEDPLENNELWEKENDFAPEETEKLSDEDLDEDEDEDEDDPDMNDEDEDGDEEENDDDDDPEEEEDEAGLAESEDSLESRADPWPRRRGTGKYRRYGYRRPYGYRRYGYRRGYRRYRYRYRGKYGRG